MLRSESLSRLWMDVVKILLPRTGFIIGTKQKIEGKRTSDVRMSGSAHLGRRFQELEQRWR